MIRTCACAGVACFSTGMHALVWQKSRRAAIAFAVTNAKCCVVRPASARSRTCARFESVSSARLPAEMPRAQGGEDYDAQLMSKRSRVSEIFSDFDHLPDIQVTLLSFYVRQASPELAMAQRLCLC